MTQSLLSVRVYLKRQHPETKAQSPKMRFKSRMVSGREKINADPISLILPALHEKTQMMDRLVIIDEPNLLKAQADSFGRRGAKW